MTIDSLIEKIENAIVTEVKRQNLAEEKDVAKLKYRTLIGVDGILCARALTKAIIAAMGDASTRKDGDATNILAAIENPPAPNANLLAASRRYMEDKHTSEISDTDDEMARGALEAIHALLDDGGIPRGTFSDDHVRNLVALYNQRGDRIAELEATREPVSGALERGAVAVKRLFDLSSTPPDTGLTPEDVAKAVLDVIWDAPTSNDGVGSNDAYGNDAFRHSQATEQPVESSDVVGSIFNELARVCREAVPRSSLANLLPSHRLAIANAIAPLFKREVEQQVGLSFDEWLGSNKEEILPHIVDLMRQAWDAGSRLKRESGGQS